MLADDEKQDFLILAKAIARDRDAARRLSMPFACRLLDMCLMEVAMNWEGRECSSETTRGMLSELLEIKLRLAMAERDGGEGSLPLR